MRPIERVGVIGAGVMGAGIAAQVANAGVPVVLLDLAIDEGDDRSAIARGAVERMSRTSPAPLMHRRNARRIRTGNLEDDFALLADCDWIVEVVVERADVKRALYERVETVRRDGSMVSSNTSTIPLATLMEGMSDRLQRDFAVTHFFNPPRYMRLLEIVRGLHTDPEVIDSLGAFGDRVLGKGVVECNDTPGFIANRIGVFWLQCAVVEAIARGLDVETADAVIGPALGIPRTGVFGLVDLVGLDLMPHVLASMDSLLGADDPFRRYMEVPDRLQRMIEAGLIGRKGAGGFYRLGRDSAGTRVKEAMDLSTGDYRPAKRPRPECVAAAKSGGALALLEHPSEEGAYARKVMLETLHYAAVLIPEVSSDVHAVDEAMRLGYGWQFGPFELIDRIGTRWCAGQFEAVFGAIPEILDAVEESVYRIADRSVERVTANGYRPVRRPDGVLRLDDAKRGAKPVVANASASLWDIGEDVACLEFHTKMNALDGAILELIGQSVELVPGRFRGMIIHNEADHFSAGVNLGEVLFAVNMAAWEAIGQSVEAGQAAFGRLKYAPFPVVGAPAGMALGGGCEVLLHCDAIVAHAELYMGLVEVGVGLVPGWGGCKELLARAASARGMPGGPMPPVMQAFETISMAKVSNSADEARDLLFLRPDDEIVMNRDRVLAAARSRVLDLCASYAPPEPPVFRLPGRSGAAALDMAVTGFVQLGKASEHDARVGAALARVLTGADADLIDEVDEPALLGLERDALVDLVRTPATVARIEHMLETGKPLRN